MARRLTLPDGRRRPTDVPEVPGFPRVTRVVRRELARDAVAVQLFAAVDHMNAAGARMGRIAMLLSALLVAPVAWLAQSQGNHALWLTFMLFMVLRSVTLAMIAWRLNRSDGWFSH